MKVISTGEERPVHLKKAGIPGLLFSGCCRISSVQYATTTGFVHFCYNFVLVGCFLQNDTNLMRLKS